MLTPKEVAHEACKIGLIKVTKKNQLIFVSAILAGLFIGLGYYGYLVLASTSSGEFAFLGKFLGAFIFPVGLILIIIAGGELFTGNCLITLGCLNKKYHFKLVLKNLGIVYLGNFVGALILVLLIYSSRLNEQTKNYIIYLGEIKANLGFFEAISKGILCNILVALAVYISYAGQKVTDKIIACMLPVTLFVVSGYEHSVANMFILPLAEILGGDITLIDILFRNLLPVTIGNFIGGALVALSYYYIFVRENK